MKRRELTGFVLAGGKSSRMGSDKFALRLDKESFLTRAAKVLQPVCREVRIVLNQNQSIDTQLPVVRDVYPERGALGGIHAALRDCDTEFAFMLAVDLPFVGSEVVERICAVAWSENEAATVPRQSDGRLQPLCAVYRVAKCLPPLEEFLDRSESASVRSFLDLVSLQIIPQSFISDDDNTFFNVNSPSDFAAIREANKKE